MCVDRKHKSGCLPPFVPPEEHTWLNKIKCEKNSKKAIERERKADVEIKQEQCFSKRWTSSFYNNKNDVSLHPEIHHDT